MRLPSLVPATRRFLVDRRLEARTDPRLSRVGPDLGTGRVQSSRKRREETEPKLQVSTRSFSPPSLGGRLRYVKVPERKVRARVLPDPWKPCPTLPMWTYGKAPQVPHPSNLRNPLLSRPYHLYGTRRGPSKRVTNSLHSHTALLRRKPTPCHRRGRKGISSPNCFRH